MPRSPLPSFLFVLALLLALTACGGGPTSTPAPPVADEPSLPSNLSGDFIQVLPRGRIASVDAPEFVSAAEAEIADDAWVLGVVIEGQARAYSLNLLNRHEIVNDQIGATRFAAVW